MNAVIDHLVVVPVVLPLVAGAVMLLLDERRRGLKAAISAASLVLLVATAIVLLRLADSSATLVYRLGSWPAPFGIVLAVDRLSAVMVLITPVLGLAAHTFSLARWHRAAPRFHALLQFMMMGLNGAFLTGDLFNLFVFFELLLAASYGLALHGSGAPRVRASLHYIVVNLTASLFFLVGVALIYGVTGTLNMADLALRIPAVAPDDRVLVEVGASILAIAFLTKAAMWPLGFWLPSTYAAASAPAAALFSILTKVGVYAVLRLSLLFFGGVGDEMLLLGGIATLTFGLIGLLSTREMARLAGFSVLVSSGTLLAAIGMADTAATGAALYYLVVSTLGIGAFFLLIELVERSRAPGADMIAVTAEIFGESDDEIEPEEEVGVAIPATKALLGLSFACCALLVAGLPPLPGFVAKFALLAALFDLDALPLAVWVLLALLMLSGLASIIALGRAGVRVFWGAPDSVPPRVRFVEMAPIAALLVVCLGLTVLAGPTMRYMQDAALALHSPTGYIQDVLQRR